MKLTWTKGLNTQQKEEVKASFGASALLRERVKIIMQEKIDSCRKAAISEDAYNSPNWAFKQADAIGYERALNEVISLMI